MSFFTDNIDIIAPLLILLFGILVTFGVAVAIKDNSIVDTFWGLGFIIGTVSIVAFAQNTAPRALLVLGLIALWGLRLSIYIGIRHKDEDFRYKQMRQDWHAPLR